MKRPNATSSPFVGSTGHPDALFANRYPNLNTYLTDGSWEDGKSRETSALSFTVKDGAWCAALNDKALKTSLYSTGDSMEDCMDLMEGALADGSGQWRGWKRGK